MFAVAIGSSENDVENLRFKLMRSGVRFTRLTTYSLQNAAEVLPPMSLHPDVVFYQCNGSHENDCRAIAEIRSRTPNEVVAVTARSETRCVLDLVRSGANDCVLDSDEFRIDVRVIVDRISSHRKENGTRGIITSVLSVCGGCGGSTVAVNLGACLARQHESAAVVELNKDGGDLATLLNIEAYHSLADLATQTDEIDSEMLEKTLARHVSGIHLLSSPPAESESVEPRAIETTETVLRLLSTDFSHVVIDLETIYEPEKISAAMMSDRLLLTFRLEFSCLVKLSRVLKNLDDIAFPLDRVQLVANRVGRKAELKPADAAGAVNRQIDYLLPDDFPMAVSASNVGNPLVLEFPDSKLARAYRAMSGSLSPCIAANT